MLEESKQNSTLLGPTLCAVENPIHSFSFHVYAEIWNESQCLLKVGRISAIFSEPGSHPGLLGFYIVKLSSLCSQILPLRKCILSVFKLRQFWSDSVKNRRSLQSDQNTGDEGGLLSSKV